MIQITPKLVSDELRSMFHPGMPTGIRALAVLAGGNAGRILTDDPLRPRWSLVWEADDGTLYRGGAYSAAVLKEAVGLLRQEGIVGVLGSSFQVYCRVHWGHHRHCGTAEDGGENDYLSLQDAPPRALVLHLLKPLTGATILEILKLTQILEP